MASKLDLSQLIDIMELYADLRSAVLQVIRRRGFELCYSHSERILRLGGEVGQAEAERLLKGPVSDLRIFVHIAVFNPQMKPKIVEKIGSWGSPATATVALLGWLSADDRTAFGLGVSSLVQREKLVMKGDLENLGRLFTVMDECVQYALTQSPKPKC